MVAVFRTHRIDINAYLFDRAGMHVVLRIFIMLVAAAVLAGCAGQPRKTAPSDLFAHPATHDANPNDILFRAIGLVGTPYRYGGNTPASGFDCSGLVDYVFRDVAGIALPRTAQAIAAIDAPRVARENLQSGDLVFFHHRSRRVSHIGIYVGKGRFVHAPNEGGTVRLDTLDSPYWNEHYTGAKRVLR
jgi:cell wall-associated NlpC family hydrolase